MKSIIRRAILDTKRQLGGVSGVIVFFVVVIGAVAAHGFLFGPAAMIAEWPPAVSALVAYGIVCTTLLLVNLAAAPYRLERIKNKEAARLIKQHEGRVERLSATIDELEIEKPKFILKIIDTITGGDNPSLPNMICITISLKLTNMGRFPSSADGWGIFIKEPGSENYEPVQLRHFQDSVVFDDDNQRVTVSGEEMIYLKTTTPVAQGQSVIGTLVGITPERNIIGSEIVVRCHDVFGSEALAGIVVQNGSSEIIFLPGLKREVTRLEKDD